MRSLWKYYSKRRIQTENLPPNHDICMLVNYAVNSYQNPKYGTIQGYVVYHEQVSQEEMETYQLIEDENYRNGDSE